MDKNNSLVKAKGGEAGVGGGGGRRWAKEGKGGTPAIMSTLKITIKKIKTKKMCYCCCILKPSPVTIMWVFSYK